MKVMLLNPDKTFIAASDQIQHLPRVSSHLFPKKKNQALILIYQVDRKLHFLFVEKQQQKKYI